MKGISITAASFLLFLASFSPVSAQMLWFQPQPAVLSAACISIPTNMRIGATDASSAGAVSVLQTFLAQQGYFSAAYLGTGRFGPLTHNALVRFQAASGLPATGYFGPMTRAVMQQLTCGGGTVIVPPVQTTPSLYALNPNQTFVGATIQITGYGFTEDNTIYMDGSVVAQHVPTSSSGGVACAVSDPWCYGGARQTLLFTVPSALSPYCPSGFFCAQYMRQVTPGNYAITVQNRNGTSNALTLTVTGGGGGSGTISINGLDAPSSLTIGQTGTWTVRASVPNYSGNLRYSVTWGDENTMMSGIMMPQESTIQTSATFTHAYQYAGVYTPRFTVTDDWGGSVTTSATVQVNPIY